MQNENLQFWISHFGYKKREMKNILFILSISLNLKILSKNSFFFFKLHFTFLNTKMHFKIILTYGVRLTPVLYPSIINFS